MGLVGQESWAGTYLEVLAGLLVFAWGLPYLLLRRSLPRELAAFLRVTQARQLVSLALPACLLLSILGLVWWPAPSCSYEKERDLRIWQVTLSLDIGLLVLSWSVLLRQIPDPGSLFTTLRSLDQRLATANSNEASSILEVLVYLSSQANSKDEITQILQAIDGGVRRLHQNHPHVAIEPRFRFALRQAVDDIAQILVRSSDRRWLREGHLLMQIAEGDPDALFGIGMLGLRNSAPFLTQPAVLKLLAHSLRTTPPSGTHFLLGLAASLAQTGTTAGTWAQRVVLGQLGLAAEPNERILAFGEATKALVGAGEYETADALETWGQLLSKATRPAKPKTGK